MRIKNFIFYCIIIFVSGIAAVFSCILIQALTHPPRHANTSGYFQALNPQYISHNKLGYAIPPISTGYTFAHGKTFPCYYGSFAERKNTPDEPSNPNANFLIIGCSLSWGQGISNENTFSKILAHDLHRTANNISVSGSGTIYNAIHLEELSNLTPEYVIYGFFEDHLYRNVRLSAPVDHPFLHRQIHVVEKNGRLQESSPSFWQGDFQRLLRKWYKEQYIESKETSFIKDIYWTALITISQIEKNFIRMRTGRLHRKGFLP